MGKGKDEPKQTKFDTVKLLLSGVRQQQGDEPFVAKEFVQAIQSNLEDGYVYTTVLLDEFSNAGLMEKESNGVVKIVQNITPELTSTQLKTLARQ